MSVDGTAQRMKFAGMQEITKMEVIRYHECSIIILLSLFGNLLIHQRFRKCLRLHASDIFHNSQFLIREYSTLSSSEAMPTCTTHFIPHQPNSRMIHHPILPVCNPSPTINNRPISSDSPHPLPQRLNERSYFL